MEVICYYEPSQDLYAFSKLHVGLCLLAERGELRLRFRTPLRGNGNQCAYAATLLEIRANGRGTRRVAIDLYDRGDVFTQNLLESCDVYLKRSYYKPEVARLSEAVRPKVAPFGLNYACRAARPRLLATIWPRLVWRTLGGMTQGLDVTRREKYAWLQFLPSPDYRSFELEPVALVRPEIIFQTRVWTQNESDTEPVEPLNQSRVALVRALRKHFPKHFRGGLIPTELARRLYPDALTKEPTRPAQYLEASKRSLIGISSRGLHHSTPFKLAEYLGGSKCIVSEPPRNGLPNALENGREILEFRGPDECVAVCEEILSRPQLAADLRHAAWSYYMAYVEPAAHVRDCLERVFARASEGV